MTLRKVHPQPLLKSPLNYSRNKDSFNHAKEISKEFGILESVLDWCKEEMSADWRWQLVEISNNHRPGRYIFYFDSERDYLAFIMKWA